MMACEAALLTLLAPGVLEYSLNMICNCLLWSPLAAFVLLWVLYFDILGIPL